MFSSVSILYEFKRKKFNDKRKGKMCMVTHIFCLHFYDDWLSYHTGTDWCYNISFLSQLPLKQEHVFSASCLRKCYSQVTQSRLLCSSNLNELRGTPDSTQGFLSQTRVPQAVPVIRSSLSIGTVLLFVCWITLGCSDLHINVLIYFYVSQWNRQTIAHSYY